MPLNHQNATASISVTGLALGCYNPRTSNWEVAFIRHPQHVLIIDVTKQTPEGPSRNRFEIDQNHRIFVDAGNAISPQEPLFMPGQFDRKVEGNDLEDLRWIVDFETELNNRQRVTLKHPEYPVTEMYVSQPLLYADKEMFALGSMKLVNAENGADVRLFGKLSEAVKADITCQDGGAVILRIAGPSGFSIDLPHFAGATHSIVITNLCPPVGKTNGQPVVGDAAENQPVSTAQPSSDFKLYYNIIEDTQGVRFDLRPEFDDGSGSDAVCNGTFLGVSNRLFPLP